MDNLIKYAKLTTMQLANLLDERDSRAYAAMAEEDSTEEQFRSALIDALVGMDTAKAADAEAEIVALLQAKYANMGNDALAEHLKRYLPKVLDAIVENTGSTEDLRKRLLDAIIERDMVDIKDMTTPTRTPQVALLIELCGANFWGEWSKYPKKDWQYEVENGDTVLGYWEWLYVQALNLDNHTLGTVGDHIKTEEGKAE